ncbi:hypothetical protein FHW89_002519 [Mucilaginibacter sp. SG564]|nr:hypothetical protein [Mucilaginibacter sp. SG564]
MRVILPLILALGTALFVCVFRLSRRFGEHGLSKYLAKKRLPGFIACRSRKLFLHLKTRPYENQPGENTAAD